MDLSALRYANHGAGYFRRLAFFLKCIDSHAGTVFGFRMPISRSKFQIYREDAAFQLAGGGTVVVSTNRGTSLRSLSGILLRKSPGRENREQSETQLEE